MVPLFAKSLIVPGTTQFLLLALIPGTLLLYRRRDRGRSGRIWVTTLLVSYLVMSIPATAIFLVDAVSPSYPPVQTAADARGATAIVLLSAGMDTFRSRGDVFDSSPREDALRLMEAVRVYHVLGRPLVVVSGGLGNERTTQAGHMAKVLKNLGVDPQRIVEEARATNTRDHALFVPPILKANGISQFVLVTSQQHIARSLRAFRKVGWNPVPSTPEIYVARTRLEWFIPGRAALEASTAMWYDVLAFGYYWLRGWV